jgi:hypothetical protein
MITIATDNPSRADIAQNWLINEARKSETNRERIFGILIDWEFAIDEQHFLSFYRDIYDIAIAKKIIEMVEQ